MHKVVVRDLEKRYDAVLAAQGVSFEIDDGEIFGLLGPNGSGKTTTLECVIGLRQPDAGHIEVCGMDARQHPTAVKEKIGAVLQTIALQDKITPREALELFASFYTRTAAASALLQRFALTEKADAPFDSLSAGQRQRLAVALAFVNNPELIFLDEPTSGLDPQSRRDLHAEIVRMKRDGHTVLLTTHNIDEAEQLCDRIAIIDSGRIIASGPPRDLIAASTSAQSVLLRTAPPLAIESLAGIPGIDDLMYENATITFRTKTPAPTLSALMQIVSELEVEVLELHARKAKLEDVFLALTSEESQ
ncbi:MAG TPA: ABC transporter ATP-binding protein [Vicinamibacterales bacterium]|nr:ABC transporter ATP-binding protein [Vicinamibacterales bacterium]